MENDKANVRQRDRKKKHTKNEFIAQESWRTASPTSKKVQQNICIPNNKILLLKIEARATITITGFLSLSPTLLSCSCSGRRRSVRNPPNTKTMGERCIGWKENHQPRSLSLALASLEIQLTTSVFKLMLLKLNRWDNRIFFEPSQGIHTARVYRAPRSLEWNETRRKQVGCVALLLNSLSLSFVSMFSACMQQQINIKVLKIYNRNQVSTTRRIL